MSDLVGTVGAVNDAHRVADPGQAVAEYWAAGEARDGDRFGAPLAEDVVYEAPAGRSGLAERY